MSAIPETDIPNRPQGQPVFDFAIGDDLCRVVLATVSNDGQQLKLAGWGYLIDSAGQPLLSAATAAPTATADSMHTVALSGVMAGTHTLYDGWCKYAPPAGAVLDAENLPAGWSSGAGAPTGTPAYGSGHYDTAAGQGWVYTQGCLNAIGEGIANALSKQIDTTAKLAALGL